MKPLSVRLGSHISFSVQEAGDALISQIKIMATFVLPDMQRPPSREYKPAQKWCGLVIDGDAATLPRGMIGDFQRICKALRRDVEFASKAQWDQKAEAVAVNEIIPRTYQSEIISLLVQKRQGWICLPCGGGKTVTGALAALATGQSVLVLVHTIDLVNQWIKTFKAAGVGWVRRIAEGTGSVHPLINGEIAVAMVHALQGEQSTKFLSSVGCLILDEAHHCPANMFANIVARCPARWRWGFTATPERSDGWSFLLPAMFGQCLFSMPAKALIDLGYLLRPVIIPVLTGWEPKAQHFRWHVTCAACGAITEVGWQKWQDKKLKCRLKRCAAPLPADVAAAKQGDIDWAITLTDLSEDPDRIALIAKISEWGSAHSRVQLVLTARKTAIAPIVGSLRAVGCHVAGVSSETGDRDKQIAALVAGRLNALVATQLADEGLDVPCLDTLISANPGKDTGKAVQRAGRTCRPSGLSPIVFDLVDNWPTFKRQWSSRNRAYVDAYGCASAQPMDLDVAIKLAEMVK